MRYKTIVCISLFFVLISLKITAQQKDFGDVSSTELEMEIYVKDSTANAIVLFDVAEASIDEDLEVRMKRHVRIKVLTDEGVEEGDISLRFVNKDKRQGIRKIKASSYNINESGKIEKANLGRRDKFENEVSENISEIKFTIPQIKKGSVIEYEYEWNSESIYDLPDWYFQRSIPVVWSDYRIKVPDWFTFMIAKRSYHKFHVEEQSVYNDRATIRYALRTGPEVGLSNDNSLHTGSTKKYRTETFDYSGTEYYWAMKDLPAIKREPYMKALDDYYAQVRFQLSRIQFPNSLAENVLNTWPMLVEILEEHEDFGKRIDENKFLKNKSAEISAGEGSELDKMIKIYDHIRERISWNNKYRLLADDKLEDVYKAGKGSGVEINMILTQMLKGAGLNSSPVILSTRSHGELIDLYPIASQFNHAIVYAEADGKPYLLDATDKDRPYTMLQPAVFNEKGLQIDGENSRWLPLVNSTSNKSVQIMNVELEDSGNLKGEIQASLTGQLSYLFAKDLESEISDQSEFITENNEAILVDSLNIDELKSDNEVRFKAYFRIPDYKDLSSDVAYLNPLVIDEEFRNPFTLKERQYPVDYEFPFSRSYIANIALPENWIIEEEPQSILYRLKDNKGEFKRLVQNKVNSVTIVYTLTILKNRFMPEEYEDLKSMYELMEKSLKENFVLKKTS